MHSAWTLQNIDKRPSLILKLGSALHHAQFLAAHSNGQPIINLSCNRNEITCHIREARLAICC
jgi:hypothetical protein